jgi:protein TonB
MLRQTVLPQRLSVARIAGTSAAIALHAIVLMLLFTPTTWAPPRVDAPPETPWIPPVDIKIPQPQPIADDPKPKPEIPVISRPIAKPVAAQQVIADANSNVQSIPVDSRSTDIIDTGQAANVVAEISADVAPTPTYPPLALRDGTTGLVLLRIEVDATGRPVTGSIEKSSGSRLLDQAALKFVLARWHFNPALRAGTPVSAVALVPISFTLD